MAGSEQPSTPTSSAGSRGYNSPLRQAQADQTRDLILDALTALLADLPSDEISIRDLAGSAGVAERTVYRHFPDRTALHHGLSQRARDVGGVDLDDDATLDDLAAIMPAVYAGFDEHEGVTRAAVLLNADPRRLASDTKQRTHEWMSVTRRTFPELSELQTTGLTAVTRMLGSSQTWLRFREEFGLSGEESGGIAAWAANAMLAEVRRGNLPPSQRSPLDEPGLDEPVSTKRAG